MNAGKPPDDPRARRKLVLVLVVALAVLALALAVALAVFLPRTGGRGTRSARGAVDAGGPRAELELQEAAGLPAEEEDGGARADGEGAAGSSARSAVRGTKARAAPPRAPIRGRLVVRETLDPIAGSFALRVRTADLELGESLVTRPDGRFTTTTPFPRSVLLALVKDGDRELVDHEAPFDPEAKEEWQVFVSERQWPTFAHGTVVDRGGAPVPLARVQLVPLDPTRPFAEAEAKENGRFEVRGLRAGVYRLHVQGRWSRSEPAEVDLASGPNDLGLLVVDPAGAGDVRVRIVSEGEEWPDARLVLRERSGRELVVPTSTAEPREDGCEVLFPLVPSGDYVLTVLSLDGRQYTPERVELRPPALVELEAGAPSELLTFRAHDAASDERLPDFYVLFRVHGLWERRSLAQPSAHLRELTGETEERNALTLTPALDRWIVWRVGWQPVTGRHEPGRGGTVDVALERGGGEVVQIDDVEADVFGAFDLPAPRRGVGGVEMLVDGELAGVSDEDGFVLYTGESDSEMRDYRLPGWRVVRTELTGGFLWRIGLVRSP